jgi:membrane glycosyltransferase
MWYLPKIAGALDVLLRTAESKRFGGRWRFSFSLFLEMLFSLLMTPIAWLNHTIFIIGLAFGEKGGWTRQTRDDYSVSIAHAFQQFWPHTLIGIGLASLLYFTHPATLWYGMLFFGGLIFSIPLVILTSQAWLGRWMVGRQLLALPEEITPPAVLLPLQLSALEVNSPRAHNS